MQARLKWFFSDKQGKIAIWQTPNVLLWGWIVSTVLSHVLPYGQINFIAELLSFGLLFTWAYLEITSGLSPFRRVLGVAILILIIRSRI